MENGFWMNAIKTHAIVTFESEVSLLLGLWLVEEFLNENPRGGEVYHEAEADLALLALCAPPPSLPPAALLLWPCFFGVPCAILWSL